MKILKLHYNFSFNKDKKVKRKIREKLLLINLYLKNGRISILHFLIRYDTMILYASDMKLG